MIYSPGPMTQEDWKACRCLAVTSRDDRHQWGELAKIDRSVIKTLDAFGTQFQHRIRVTCGTQGKHVDGSFHYPTQDRLGIALDFMMPNVRRRELPEIFLQLLRFPFGGIGIYTEWKLSPELPSIGGFHVDMRPSSIKATWMKGPDAGYTAATIKNMKVGFI